MRPFAPQTMMSSSVRIRLVRVGWMAAADAKLKAAKRERVVEKCILNNEWLSSWVQGRYYIIRVSVLST